MAGWLRDLQEGCTGLSWSFDRLDDAGNFLPIIINSNLSLLGNHNIVFNLPPHFREWQDWSEQLHTYPWCHTLLQTPNSLIKEFLYTFYHLTLILNVNMNITNFSKDLSQLVNSTDTTDGGEPRCDTLKFVFSFVMIGSIYVF